MTTVFNFKIFPSLKLKNISLASFFLRYFLNKCQHILNHNNLNPIKRAKDTFKTLFHSAIKQRNKVGSEWGVDCGPRRGRKVS